MIHINKFIDRIKVLDAKQVKNFTMSAQEARDLHGDITKLLVALHDQQQRLEAAKRQTADNRGSGLDGGKW